MPLSGSPPRMRGKAVLASTTLYRSGITPAYAGKRDLVISGSGDIEDHPRVCGEKMQPPTPSSGGMGSPPRMRGKVYKITPPWFSIRITPAYAGKRAWFSYCGCQDRDHPRVCGEKALSTFSSRKNSGSPPRMRGKVLCGRSSAGRHGITPAYAEKRGRTIRVNRTVKDYPRVCGEKMVSMIPHRRSRGSPPRMRGKVCIFFLVTLSFGITPAYAGKRTRYHHH